MSIIGKDLKRILILLAAFTLPIEFPALATPPFSAAFGRFETALSCLTVSLHNQFSTWPRIAETGPFHELWHNEETFMKQVQPFQKGLFLADGADVETARDVARRFPEKRITATDIEIWGEPGYRDKMQRYGITREEHRDRHPEFYKEREILNNLATKEVDITQPFPFEDNQFDLVFLAKGLCRCYGSPGCCAGIKFEREEMAHPIR